MFDNLTVAIKSGEVTLTVKPNGDNFNDAQTNHQVADDSLVAGKALLTGYFPTLTSVTVSEVGGLTDQFGHSSTGSVSLLRIDKPTSDQFDYSGLKDAVYVTPSKLFCISTFYNVRPIWDNLDSGDRGCMKTPTGGN